MFSDKASPDERTHKTAGPCSVVIFGVTGDLTARKLMPALFNLFIQGHLPDQFQIVGVARKEKSDSEFQSEIMEALQTHCRAKPSAYKQEWERFATHLKYHQTLFDKKEGYERLKGKLIEFEKSTKSDCGRLFYFSTPPSFFPEIASQLKSQQLITEASDALHEKGAWSRVIVEKPFGHNLESALELDKHLQSLLHESQVYRIDHYLGKDTVQNLLVLRLSNVIFESIWNHRYIDHVQISVSEELGIGRRGIFFEEAGILRDFVQNHLMQLLSLVAMEPPSSLRASDIRNEKVKLLHAIRAIDPKNIEELAVRGQYTRATLSGKNICGYREEKDVNPNSNVETFAALKLYIDNWRWSGVPFYLRAGKRMSQRASQIAIVFKAPPAKLFDGLHNLQNNALVIRIQPNDGMSLKINCKLPNLNLSIGGVSMDFDFDSLGHMAPEAYERLLLDATIGDNTLFARSDEVLRSWEILEPILKAWGSKPLNENEFYQAGQNGPINSHTLLERGGHRWYEF